MMNRLFLVAMGLILIASCAKLPVGASTEHLNVNVQADSVTFAIIGDYGDNSAQEGEVAKMVKGWNPEFIITMGDNNYPAGSAKTIANHIGNYYCDYIYNPDAPAGQVCKGKAALDSVNRFFPCPGNHDNRSGPRLKPYVDYFALPGNERYYDFTWGPVHFYSLNTGIGGKVSYPASSQARWLKHSIAQSKKPFDFVYFHHPPYSTSRHGSAKKMRWPFAEMGFEAVLCGHEHIYERVSPKNNAAPLYLICGNSGNDHLYPCFVHPVDTALFNIFCDNKHFGATKVRVNATTAIFEYYGTTDPIHPIDVYYIRK